MLVILDNIYLLIQRLIKDILRSNWSLMVTKVKNLIAVTKKLRKNVAFIKTTS